MEEEEEELDVAEPQEEAEAGNVADPDQPPKLNRGDGKRKRITQLEFYSNKIAVRKDVFNTIHYGGHLTQQYLVDAYIKVEANRIKYVIDNQTKLHVESYKGLMDYVERRAEREEYCIGKVRILPSTWIGSQRAMKQAYQDAMAICGVFGKPTYFLTFTCNPKWEEITNNIACYQSASDRPDLVARVFNLKKNEIIDDIVKRKILGEVIARIHVIEFQKRGLPHCHMLIWIKSDNVPTTSEQMDKVICAEIPDKDTHPRLYHSVMKNMIHGPCGKNINKDSPCMDEDSCTKKFPKEFVAETDINTNGYPTYRRRNTGKTEVLKRGNKTYQVDNTWVVPYNPYLTLKYDCLINLEYCASITSVKYIFKYVYKGHDCVDIQTTIGEVGEGENGKPTINWDEVSHFLDTRYVSAPEACWRLFKFPLSYRSHPVTRLAVHLPLEQTISFTPGEEAAAVIANVNRDSTLTAWFKLNRDCEEARNLHYREIPHHFWFGEKKSRWVPRKKQARVIGRIYTVGVKQVERFSLRLLLIAVKGATSFENLRTVDGVVHQTFKSAAAARGLLEDDIVWERTMDEAASFSMPPELRQLFVDLCVHCNLTDANQLFQKNLHHLIEDFIHRGHNEEVATNLTLRWIQERLQLNGFNMESDFQLPAPNFELINQMIAEEQGTEELNRIKNARLRGDAMKAQLNEDQRALFDIIMTSISVQDSNQPRLFFLDAPGGTGKTFLYNTLINWLEGQSKKVIAVASTGIASTLLTDGTTYHSQFKIYPPITEVTTSMIQENDFSAMKIREASLIISDEATMKLNHSLNAIDQLFRRLMKSQTFHSAAKWFFVVEILDNVFLLFDIGQGLKLSSPPSKTVTLGLCSVNLDSKGI